MSEILICVNGGDASSRIVAVGNRLAEVMHEGRPRLVHVFENDDAVLHAIRRVGLPLELLAGAPDEAILRKATDRDVSAVVIGARENAAAGPVGKVAHALLTGTRKPVLVVPRGLVEPVGFARVLLPLDGSVATSSGAEDITRCLTEAGAQVTALHVFGAETVPQFWDRPEYEGKHWGNQFLEHHCAIEGVRLQLGVGDAPGQQVLDAAGEGTDLIILVWGQDLSSGHARIVQDVLARAPASVLLLPARRAA